MIQKPNIYIYLFIMHYNKWPYHHENGMPKKYVGVFKNHSLHEHNGVRWCQVHATKMYNHSVNPMWPQPHQTQCVLLYKCIICVPLRKTCMKSSPKISGPTRNKAGSHCVAGTIIGLSVTQRHQSTITFNCQTIR